MINGGHRYMRELKKNEFDIVEQLFHDANVHHIFAFSVVEGKQPGRIFIDNNINPTCCLIVSNSGKYLVAGDAKNIIFNGFLLEYLSKHDNHNHYYDLYNSSNEWIEKIDEILSDNAVRLNRNLYQWDKSKLSSIINWSIRLPESYELRKLDEYLFEKYVNEMDSSYSQLWESASRFIQNGFGFCILKDGEFISICNTYYVKQGFAEIDIVTKKEYRSQGFATIVCSAFIKFCVEDGIMPLWDCDAGNESSKKLAEKLGFKCIDEYQMHWWHEDKNVISNYLKKFNIN